MLFIGVRGAREAGALFHVRPAVSMLLPEDVSPVVRELFWGLLRRFNSRLNLSQLIAESAFEHDYASAIYPMPRP